MNPLFLAHLLGDFLFQPHWLVKLKEKSTMGIVLHSLIHFMMLIIFCFPGNSVMWLFVISIAVIHGIIDRTKIALQNKGMSFGIGFFGDQVLHFLIIILGMFITYNFAKSPSIEFWKSDQAYLVANVLIITSFIFALSNIAFKEKATLSRRDLYIRISAITASFLLFTLLPELFL